MNQCSHSLDFPISWLKIQMMGNSKGYLFLLIFLSQTLLTFGQNKDHEAWKTKREQELLAEDGWINLIGLLWIDQEKAFLNQVSRDSLTVSREAGKNNIGSFQFTGDSVWFQFNPKTDKRNKLQLPAKTLQYPVENYSQGGVFFDRWKWTVINRGGQFGMRLRDLRHPKLADFEAIPYFDYDSDYSVPAFFQPKFNETIGIPNVLGQVIEWKVMGILKFELQGEKYELTALEDGGKLFVIFSDLTNENETYPIGRYLYVNFPDAKGNTRIDFNYAYNPPCAFTAFATCPIPPKVNRLEISVLAGEKMPH